jgi:hypothetical protein
MLAFGPVQSARAASAEPNKEPIDVLLTKAQFLFRQKLMQDGIAAAAFEFDPHGKTGFLTSAPTGKKMPDLWSEFFAGSFMLCGKSSAGAVSAYYNPFYDGLLITQWDVLDGRPLITGARITAGCGFAGQAAGLTGLPQWVRESSKQSFAKVLSDQCAAVTKRFEALYPQAGGTAKVEDAGAADDETAEELLRRIVLGLDTLIGIFRADSPEYCPEIRKLISALRQDDAEVLQKILPSGSIIDAGDIFTVSHHVRSRLTPFYALSSSSNVIVFIGHPDVRYFYFAAVFKRESEGARLSLLVPGSIGVEQ